MIELAGLIDRLVAQLVDRIRAGGGVWYRSDIKPEIMILIEIMNFNYQHITAPPKFIMLRLDGSLTFTIAMPQGIALGDRMIIIVIILLIPKIVRLY